MKNILITGINGFLGSHLAKRLSKEFQVIGLEKNIEELNRLKGFNFTVYDIDNIDLKDIFIEHKIIAVIHTATVYRKKDEPLETLLETNLMLPVRLFELANKYNVDLFINTDSFFNIPNSKYSYLSEYTLSKQHVLDWLKAIKEKCKLINLKLFHMYGLSDAPHKFIPQMISSIKNNKESIELTAGKQKRDFIYIDDVVSAYLYVLNNYNQIQSNYTEFEVGTGETTSIKDLVFLIKTISNSSTELKFGALPYRKGEIMEAKADNTELIKLGWKPEFSLTEGITNILNH